MEGQIRKSFDKITLKKIGAEAGKLAGVAAAIFIIQELFTLDFGSFTVIVIPFLRYLLGIVEQWKKGA